MLETDAKVSERQVIFDIVNFQHLGLIKAYSNTESLRLRKRLQMILLLYLKGNNTSRLLFDIQEVLWIKRCTTNTEVTGSTPSFSALSNETLNRGPSPYDLCVGGMLQNSSMKPFQDLSLYHKLFTVRWSKFCTFSCWESSPSDVFPFTIISISQVKVAMKNAWQFYISLV